MEDFAESLARVWFDTLAVSFGDEPRWQKADEPNKQEVISLMKMIIAQLEREGWALPKEKV